MIQDEDVNNLFEKIKSIMDRSEEENELDIKRNNLMYIKSKPTKEMSEEDKEELKDKIKEFLVKFDNKYVNDRKPCLFCGEQCFNDDYSIVGKVYNSENANYTSKIISKFHSKCLFELEKWAKEKGMKL